MRIRCSVIITILIVVGMTVLFGRTKQAVRATVRMLRDAPTVEGVNRTQTYPLAEQRWLRFRLNPNAITARVVTNANLPAPLPPMDESRIRPGWRYALEYKIVGSNGEALTSQLFHFRTQVTWYDDLRQGTQTTGNLLNDRRIIPADGRSLRIPLQELPGEVAELHLRIAEREAPISDVAVRVACLEEREDHDDPGLWQRLSVSRIESICEDSVYPADLLTVQQQREILHWRWRPLSPVGVEGRDYQRRLMYVYDADSVRRLSSEFSSSLPMIQRDKRLVFRVPHSQGRLRLKFESQQVGSPRVHPIVNATWYGPMTLERKSFQWEVTSSTTSYSDVELGISGGKLELCSTQPVGVQAFWETIEGIQTEINLRPLLTRTYPCGSANDTGLLYQISHSDDRPTPLCVKFRRPLPAHGIKLSPLPVSWALLDKEGSKVDSGVVELGGTPSLYDWIDVDDVNLRISDPITRYWEVSHQACAIRFAVEGGETVYVAAYNRPPGLARKTDVTSQSLERINSHSLWRTWFELRPEQHTELCKLQRTLIVQTQTRPPQVNEEILANRYQWESFKPSGEWTGRYLFLPRELGGPIRDEALAATFVELPTNKDLRINVLGQEGRSPDVSLVHLKPSEGDADLTIRVDEGQPLQVRASNTGIIELGALPPGPHSIRVDSESSVRAFVNFSRLEIHNESTQFLNRFAIRAHLDEIDFEVEKQSTGEELITLDYYFAHTARTPREIRVTVNPSQSITPRSAMVQWSCHENVFLIHPPQEVQDHGFVLGKRGPENKILSRRRCYIYLGENTPAGPIRLRVTGTNAGGDYLVVSRVTPGAYEQRQISTRETQRD